ncbi:MAG: CapA family protein [Butyrivibrio sp.]|nr:CapA family protein [Butyrivibrio sp.]
MRNKYIMLILGTIVIALSGCGNSKTDINNQEIAGKLENNDQMLEITESNELASETIESDKSIQKGESSQDLEENSEEDSGETKESIDESKKENDSAEIIMVGDILLHTPVEEAAVQEDGSINFDVIFSKTKDYISEADVAIVNQEVMIGGEELGVSGYPAFNAPYEIADALADAGFDIVCHATNHAIDKGLKGILNCIDNWEAKYPEIMVAGIYNNETESEKIKVKEVNGIKIAILNYTYGTNGIQIPSDMPYCLDMLDEDAVIKDLDKAEEEADFTIVCPHWGIEYNLTPSDEQRKWCEIFMEHGADLVLGTHPHVIQPIEMHENEDDEMLVYYSLGNFVNWTSDSGEGIANRMIGGMADVWIERDENGEVHISDYGIRPVISHVTSGINGVTVYALDDYSEQLAGQNEIVKQDTTFSYEYIKELVNDVWNGVTIE